MTQELVRYEAMCRAIAEALEVDEVKEIRNKAIALETYARQANNLDNELWAAKIRIRAERRCGQLLREMEKAKGARGNPGGQGAKIVRSNDATPQTLADLGITKDQSSQWQRLAAIPEERFEQAFVEPTARPTTAGILAKNEPPRPPVYEPMTETALWVWARLLDFERDLAPLSEIPASVLESITGHALEDVRRLAPLVSEWLREFGEAACRKNSSN